MIEKLISNFVKSFSAESAYALVHHARTKGYHNFNVLIYPYLKTLFPTSYTVLMECSVSAFYSQNFKLSFDICNDILDLKGLKEDEYKTIIHNRHFCYDHISNLYVDYPAEKIKVLTQRSQLTNALYDLVTFSITSCKRFDLFQITMNSFINCCTDIDMIDKWLCIDDNSSMEDRVKMTTMYPFFNYIFKEAKDKGHPRSMNMIKDIVDTPYLFHIEDDWKFVRKCNYITQCLEVLNDNTSIGQCLINKNYGEVAADIRIIGGDVKKTNSGFRYFIHDYVTDTPSLLNFVKKHGQGCTCHYWPHFSFRPSLLKTSVLQTVGQFNESVSHFERDYSNRYVKHGYVSAFIEGINSIHIGRLTSERNDTTKLNAYILNGEAQFEGKENLTKAITFDSFKSKFKTYVINLDRRPDRWDEFKKNAENKKLDFLKYERFSAIDGKDLLPTHQLLRLFDGNDFIMREGMVGVTLSHMKLYIELMNSDYDFYFIFEDDVDFAPNFEQKLVHLYNLLSTEDWDIAYLGHHLYKPVPEAYNKTTMPSIERWNASMSLSKSMGGISAYFITKKGAFKLMEYINKHGMTNGIDTMQQKAGDEIRLYYTLPHLTYSECYRGNKRIDSDIQYDFHSLSVDLQTRISDEISYFITLRLMVEQVLDEELLQKKVVDKSQDHVFFFVCKTEPQFLALKVIESTTVHQYYKLENSTYFFLPSTLDLKNVSRYVERLKKDNKFSIEDAILYKSKTNSI